MTLKPTSQQANKKLQEELEAAKKKLVFETPILTTPSAKPKAKAKATTGPPAPADDDSEPEQAQPKVKSMTKAMGFATWDINYIC